MDDAKVFGEVSRRVRRFKLDISTPKSPSPTSDDSTASAAAATNAVYSHIAGGIGNIPQLRGLRSAGRRGLFRLIRKNGCCPEADLVKEYTKAISILTPMFAEETQKKLIAKGKEPQNKYAAEINKQKNRPTYQLAKRRRLEEDQAPETKEESDEESEEEPEKEPEEEPEKEPEKEPKKEQTEEDITELTEEEKETKQMREEVLAAIAAITAGIEQEEMIKSIHELAKKK